jgi:DNA-3-methyladenine glycosylase
MQQLERSFFDRPVVEVARDLIGVTLMVDGVGGRLVEVEAYDQQDPASHSFRGSSLRNAAMFGPPGHAYVYKIYGIHWCLNFVCQTGSAVLVRALEPSVGLPFMLQRRGHLAERQLCSGPGKVCQALAVNISHNGLPLDRSPFSLLPRNEALEIVTGPRIGITKAADTPWRFALRGSPFLSKPLTSP